jgi:hypothetical protein
MLEGSAAPANPLAERLWIGLVGRSSSVSLCRAERMFRIHRVLDFVLAVDKYSIIIVTGPGQPSVD